MISKELLNAVFDIEVLDEICPIYADGNEIKYYTMHKYVECTAPKEFSINKYELAYKVKEWAGKRGYMFITELNTLRYETENIFNKNGGLVNRFNKPITVKTRLYITDRLSHIDEYGFIGIGFDELMVIELDDDTEPEAIFQAGEWILHTMKEHNL